MEQLLRDFVVSSPIAAALIVAIWLFLKYLARRDKEWTDTVKLINERMVEALARCTQAVHQNTEMLGRVQGLLEMQLNLRQEKADERL